MLTCGMALKESRQRKVAGEWIGLRTTAPTPSVAEMRSTAPASATLSQGTKTLQRTESNCVVPATALTKVQGSERTKQSLLRLCFI